MPSDSDVMQPVQLRLAAVADAPAVHAIYAPIVRETAISFESEPPDVEEVGDRIQRTLEHLPWLIAVGAAGKAGPAGGQDDAVLGYAYATPYRSRIAYRWSTEVSVYVARAAQQRGVGRRLYDSLFALLRAQNYHIAYAGITVPNPASVGLHEALGFERIGVFPDAGFKFGAWHDVLWMHREVAPARGDPEEPIALSRLDDAVIRNAIG